MQALWSANTSVAHCDAGAMDGGVHLITHEKLRKDGFLTTVHEHVAVMQKMRGCSDY